MQRLQFPVQRNVRLQNLPPINQILHYRQRHYLRTFDSRCLRAPAAPILANATTVAVPLAVYVLLHRYSDASSLSIFNPGHKSLHHSLNASRCVQLRHHCIMSTAIISRHDLSMTSYHICTCPFHTSNNVIPHVCCLFSRHTALPTPFATRLFSAVPLYQLIAGSFAIFCFNCVPRRGSDTT